MYRSMLNVPLCSSSLQFPISKAFVPSLPFLFLVLVLVLALELRFDTNRVQRLELPRLNNLDTG